jgi:SHS2 domain-containing protein
MDAKRPFSGFKEVPHKADIALDVFAPSLPEMFINAAMGLYHILGIRKGTADLEGIHISLEDIDVEGLLVAFLNELLYRVDAGQAGEHFRLTIRENHLEADLDLVPSLSRQREIKAVTYHNLNIVEENGVFRARLVFDL